MKKHNRKHRGYVNHADGIPQSEAEKQAKRYGKNYASIDFAFNPDLSPEDFPMTNSMEIGSLIIGNTEIEVTKAEAQKIAHTLIDGINSTQKRYRLGILQA